jgi:hypothetical protein
VTAHTVEVTFRLLEYAVTSSAGANGLIIPAGATTVTYGSDLAFTATPGTGYQVDTWSVDGAAVQTGGTSFTLSNIQTAHAVEVTFRLLEYVVTSSAGANGSVIPAGATTVTYGSDLAFTATPATGYQVDTWSVDGVPVQTGGTSYVLTDIHAAHTVEVTFRLLEYVVTSSAGENGSIAPAGATTVTYGSDLVFTATPVTGWEVATWTIDGSPVQNGGTSFTLTNIVAAHIVEVTFKQTGFDIIAIAGPNGSVSPGLSVVEAGGDEVFTAFPDFGYKVHTWSLDQSVVQTGGTNYELADIQSDHTIYVTFIHAQAYSLDEIEFEKEGEFNKRVINNNFDPDNALVLIERAAGPETGNVVMRMRNDRDSDPDSPNFGKIVSARAKGIFIKTAADKIMIRFRYLFLTSDPGVKIVVYLSDSPELLSPDDPLYSQHYIEVARIPNPPYPRPGAYGTNKFAVFQKMVWTGHLDLTEGVYIELELLEPETNGMLFAGSMAKLSNNSGGNSVFIDDWSPSVQCYGICMDINWDNFVDEADFLLVISGVGCSSTGENACMDGAFSDDGGIDTFDAVSWDWALNSDVRLLNFCGVPLTGGGGSVGMMSVSGAGRESSGLLLPRVNFSQGDLSDLLIAGKTSEMNPASKLKDSLYAFNNEGRFSGSFDPASNRCNIRLVQGPGGEIYQLNSETGLLMLDSSDTSIVPPGEIRLINITEPRYNASATVYIGIQDKGADSFGRPVLDAAFDSEYVYVVPVVVAPDGEESYTAAAKLRLLDGASPPYEVVQLYDDPPLPNDNQYRDYLREIEIDSSGNLYVLNVHAINESDILWRYEPDGTVERIDLGNPDGGSYVPAPVGMYMSKTSDMLYLTSAVYNPDDPDATVVYGFSTTGPLSITRSITVSGIQHITGITEDPQTGTLWVAGFNMYDIPLYPNPYQSAFYYPMLAKIPAGSDYVEHFSLYNPATHDLALPMSIIWTGSNGYN